MAVLSEGMFAFYGLLILLILAPLPFGSILPWAQSFLTFSVFALLAAWAVCPGISPAARSQMTDRGLGTLLALWGLAVGFAFFQVLPLAPGVLAAMSPALRDLYGWALPDYGQGGIWRSLSTTPGATIESGLLIGACGTAFFLVARYGWSRERISALAVTVVLVGAGEAVFGLIQVGGSLSSPASGTFVNRNHFAALLAMALCVGVGLLLSRWRAGAVAPVSHLDFDRWFRTTPLILACLTILAGIIFSFSRMGLTAPILMLVLFGGVWLSGPVSNRIRLVGIGVGLVLLLLMTGAWPALEVVADRFRTLEETSRVAAWEGTYALYQSSPAFGIGLGGLLDNLPRFLIVPISEPLDHSHNELLEVLAEGGVIYAALIGSGLIVYFARVVPACFQQDDPVARGLGAGCLAAIAAVLLHSLVDFPLRMPANSLYLSVIMGMGWAIILTPSPSKDSIALKAS
jgi:putative inorganic carbon (HCO3(-)) transporter